MARKARIDMLISFGLPTRVLREMAVDPFDGAEIFDADAPLPTFRHEARA
jgi:hypothetical protein